MHYKHTIYLHRVGAIGDTLLTIDLLMLLKDFYPKSKIIMGATPKYATPLLDSGLISGVIDATSRPFHLFETPFSKKDDLTKELKRYDTVIIFKRDINGIIRKRLENIEIENFAIESPFPPKESNVHVSKWLERVSKQLKHNKKKQTGQIKLSISKNTSILSARVIKKIKLNCPFLAIHPGSGSKNKCAPINTIIKIAKKIVSSHNLQLALIEGIADESICNEFRKSWDTHIINIKVNSLEILAGILLQAKGFLGCDSGISHLSSLYGVPTLVLFGPYSNPLQWGPIGTRSQWTYWDNEKKCKEILNELMGNEDN